MGALALCSADLREFDGEPYVHDLRMAQALGFDRPRKIRDLIRRNEGELTRYGLIRPTVGRIKPSPTNPRGAGRRTTEYHLNEAQALLICMFSETERAADVRQQLILVFMAWRRGKLIDAYPWVMMERRVSQLEGLIKLLAVTETSEFARAVTHAPKVFSLHHADGRLKVQRRYRWWSDLPVREAVIRLHRQMTLDQARAELVDSFGVVRSPSRSGMGRFWRQLDMLRSAS